MSTFDYDVNDWYWDVQDTFHGSAVWASARNQYVALTDATYVAWLAAGNLPTPIDTQLNLALVFEEVMIRARLFAKGSATGSSIALTGPLCRLTLVNSTDGKVYMPFVLSPVAPLRCSPVWIQNNHATVTLTVYDYTGATALGTLLPTETGFLFLITNNDSTGAGVWSFFHLPTGSTITLNAGSGTGLTAPGAMSPGNTYTVGATANNVTYNSFNALGTTTAYSIAGVGTVAWTPSGHYVTLNSPGSIQAWQSGDATDKGNYFSQDTHYFYNSTIGTLYGQIGASHVYFPAAGTTASAANAFLNSGSSPANELLRSTSSRRYKTDIASLPSGQAQDVLAQLTPVTYRSAIATDDPSVTHLGLIAEDVAEADPRLVHFGYDASDFDMVPKFEEWDEEQFKTWEDTDEDGNIFVRKESIGFVHRRRQISVDPRLKPDAVMKPESVQYERLSVLLLQEVQALRAEVVALRAMSPNPAGK